MRCAAADDSCHSHVQQPPLAGALAAQAALAPWNIFGPKAGIDLDVLTMPSTSKACVLQSSTAASQYSFMGAVSIKPEELSGPQCVPSPAKVVVVVGGW